MSYVPSDKSFNNQVGMNTVESIIILFMFSILLIVLLTLVFFVFPRTRQVVQRTQPEAQQTRSQSTPPDSASPDTSGDLLSSLADKAIIVTLVTGLIAGIAWSYKQILASLNRRAKVLILEFLSDNKPHSREEIRRALKDRRYGPMFLDALSELVEENKISVKDRMYLFPISSQPNTSGS